MALSRLGANTITALTDNTTEAKLCNTFFDDLADRVMIQGSWATTITRASLARTTNTPAYGFSYEYQLPVDPKCLKVLDINEDSVGSVIYRIEGDKLLTDVTSMKIRYIGRLTDPNAFGASLTEALEVLLSAYLALPLTGDKTTSARLRQEFQELVTLNLGIDGQQGSMELIASNDLLDVR